MSFLVDLRYVSLLGSELERFKAVGKNSWNFRCPVCGDSEHDKKKTRGYIYKDNRQGHEERLMFKCHNCGKCWTFGHFLKHVSPTLHRQYLFARLESTATTRAAFAPSKKAEEVETTEYITNYLERKPKIFKTLAELPSDHAAVKYLTERQVPEKWFKQLGYTSEFRKFSNIYKPGAYCAMGLKYDYSAIVIPMFDEHNQVFGFQGRVLGAKRDGVPRYSTTLIKEHPKMFNLNNLNKAKPFFVVEGPIDAMFLTNVVAVCGSDMMAWASEKNATFVLDCEPRNKQIVAKYGKLVDAGCNVCMLPRHAFAGMDINDMILGGYDAEEVEDLLRLHTSCGLEAQIVFSEWRKI